MAKKNTPPEEEIFDLTELIEEGSKPQRAGAAAYARQAEAGAPAASGFEAVLNQAAGGGGDSGAAFNPHEELDLSDLDDIDNIIESLQIPSQPEKAPRPEIPPQEKPAAQKADAADLDSVLDMLGGADEAPAAPTPEADSGADLDDLLASLDETPAKKPEPAGEARQAPANPDPAADLDDILSTLDEAPAKNEAAPKEQKPAPANDLDVDLDDILSSFDEEAPASAKGRPQAKKQDDGLNLDAELDDILAGAAASPAGEAEAAPEKAPAAEAAAVDDSDLPDDLDSLLEDNPEKSEAASASEPGKEIAHVRESVETEGQPITATLVNPELSQDMVANICQGLLSSHMGSVQDTIQKLSLEMGSQTAHLEDLSRTITDISRRLFATESKLAAARTKIAALEKSLESVSSLDDMFKDGTSLHTGFMEMLASAVGHAVQGVVANMQSTGVQPAQMQALAHAQEEVDGRLIQLETRLDQMEPALTARMDVVETGAARIAARLETDSLDSSVSSRIDALENRLSAIETSSHGEMAEQVESLQKQIDEFGPQLIARLDDAEAKSAQTVAALEEKLAAASDDSGMVGLASRLDELEPQLEARIAKLEESLAGQAGRIDENVDARLAAMQEKLDALSPELEARLSEAEAKASETASALEEKLAAASADSGLAALASRLDELEPQLEARIAKLEKSLASKAGKAEHGFDAKLAAMQEKIDALRPELEARLSEAEAKASETASALDEKLAAASDDSGLSSLGSRLDELEPQLEARIAKLEESLAGQADKTDANVDARLAAMQAQLDNFMSAIARIEQAEVRAGEMEARLESIADSAGNAAINALTGRVAQAEEISDEVGRKIAKLSSVGQSVNARVDSLEIRLDKLEPNFNIQIEKAAAATVARILNEEIRRLAGGK